MNTLNMISKLVILGFMLVLVLEKIDGRNLGNHKEKSMDIEAFSVKYQKVLFLLIISGSILIRCIGLGNIPGGFNQDGAMGAVDALALAQYGTDRFGTHLPAHFYAWGYGQMSVLLSYLTVPFIKVFGLSELTARLPMMLISIFGLIAVYGVVKELVSPKAALAALLFVSINPWHFMQSRWALDCNVFPHMFIIGTYFLVKGLNKSGNYYLSMIFYALCMYSYGVAFYMVPFFLLFTCIMLLICKKIKWTQIGICILVYFGISFPIYGTMLINFMKWETVSLPFVTMQYFEGSVRTNDMLFFSEEPFKQLLLNFRSLAKVVFLQKPDLIWNAIDDFGTMYLCSMPLVLLGIGVVIYWSIKKENDIDKIGCRILLIYWGCSLFTGLCINSVNVNRINIIFYSHIIFAGIAIYYLIDKWKAFIVVFLGIYIIQSSLFFHSYFTQWADRMEEVFYEDFLDAVEFAGEQNCDYYFITPDTQYEGAWHVTEILTQFALKMDAEYYQGKTNTFMGSENPYAIRFRYKNPEGGEIWSDYKVAYVIKSENLANYDLNLFAVKFFDDYSVVMPKQFADW